MQRGSVHARTKFVLRNRTHDRCVPEPRRVLLCGHQRAENRREYNDENDCPGTHATTLRATDRAVCMKSRMNRG